MSTSSDAENLAVEDDNASKLDMSLSADDDGSASQSCTGSADSDGATAAAHDAATVRNAALSDARALAALGAAPLAAALAPIEAHTRVLAEAARATLDATTDERARAAEKRRAEATRLNAHARKAAAALAALPTRDAPHAESLAALRLLAAELAHLDTSGERRLRVTAILAAARRRSAERAVHAMTDVQFDYNIADSLFALPFFLPLRRALDLPRLALGDLPLPKSGALLGEWFDNNDVAAQISAVAGDMLGASSATSQRMRSCAAIVELQLRQLLLRQVPRDLAHKAARELLEADLGEKDDGELPLAQAARAFAELRFVALTKPQTAI